MRVLRNGFWLFCISMLLVEALPAATTTNLLPGITFYDGPEKLTGKLVFLVGSHSDPVPNQVTSAAIWEFDLQRKQLRKVTMAPTSADFTPSRDGKVFCVVYQSVFGSPQTATNVFVYSDETRESSTVQFEEPPGARVAVGHHVFVGTQHIDFENGINEEWIVDFDIHKNSKRKIEFPGASRWQYQDYKNHHAAPNRTNILHFEYRAHGKRLSEGKDIQTGYYTLDVDTGDTSWFSDYDFEDHEVRAFDGSYIFFEDTMDGFRGHKLVSSSLNHFDTVESSRRDSNGARVKVLRRYSRLSVLVVIHHELQGMSPCGRYAFVRDSEVMMSPSGWVRTYSAVDVTNGNTRVLMKDTLVKQKSGFMSAVYWVE